MTAVWEGSRTSGRDQTTQGMLGAWHQLAEQRCDGSRTIDFTL